MAAPDLLDSASTERCLIHEHTAEGIKAPHVGDRLQALPGKEYVNKAGVVVFKENDCGIMTSSYTTNGVPMIMITWELTEKVVFMALSILFQWVKIVEEATPPHLFEYGSDSPGIPA